MLLQPEPVQHRFTQLLPQSAHQQNGSPEASAFELGARRSRARSAILWMSFMVWTFLVGNRSRRGRDGPATARASCDVLGCSGSVRLQAGFYCASSTLAEPKTRQVHGDVHRPSRCAGKGRLL